MVEKDEKDKESEDLDASTMPEWKTRAFESEIVGEVNKNMIVFFLWFFLLGWIRAFALQKVRTLVVLLFSVGI